MNTNQTSFTQQNPSKDELLLRLVDLERRLKLMISGRSLSEGYLFKKFEKIKRDL